MADNVDAMTSTPLPLGPTPLARSPLEGVAAAAPGAWDAGITLSEVRFRTILNLRGDSADDGFASGVKTALGVAPPVTPNTVESAGPHAIIWLGPDEWLVVTEVGTESPLAALETALSGTFATLVDLSDNYACITISGENARRVLQKGWTVDLHPRAFAPGQCAQSALAHAQVVLHQTDETPSYALYVRPSFARYTWDWLVDASAEFGVRIR